MKWSTTVLVALTCTAATVLILVGAEVVWRDVYASWYLDGGVFYEDSGLEVIFHPKPIRIGDVLLDWQGPSMILLGVILALSAHQVARQR